MCDLEAVSQEHIPPKCLFPEVKDSECGENFRINLITVPSCKKHNSKKSGDDEFLMYVLSSEFMANEKIASYMLKKLKRSIERNSSLAQKIFIDSKDVVLNSENGPIETLEVPIDSSRVDSCLDHIARGIYFHETGSQYLTRVITLADFVYHIEGDDAHEIQGVHFQLGVLAKILLSSLESNGENKDVFSYKFLLTKEPPFEAVAQLIFYKNCVATVLYINN